MNNKISDQEVSISGEESESVKDKRIENYRNELENADIMAIARFGSQIQGALVEISNEMLEGVRNRDTGSEVGSRLREMVSALRGFDVDEKESRRSSIFSRLRKGRARLAGTLAGYETVRGQIEDVSDTLNEHERILLRDTKYLDRLYERAREFFVEIGYFIEAGEQAIAELSDDAIPKAEKILTELPETAAGDAGLQAQNVRDLQAKREELARRLHDLRLTRHATMQSLPTIRLLQENNKELIARIHTTLVNTVPLWRTKLAQAVAVNRSAEAADTLKEVTDFTSELLRSSAREMRDANKKARLASARGAIDIEAVRDANSILLETLSENLRLADIAHERREQARGQLEQMERDLKQTLIGAKTVSASDDNK